MFKGNMRLEAVFLSSLVGTMWTHELGFLATLIPQVLRQTVLVLVATTATWALEPLLSCFC